MDASPTMAESPAEVPVSATSPTAAPVVYVVPTPFTNQAVFSTNLCRQPPRPPPSGPLCPPVIARGDSDKIQAVANYAHCWFDKYPQQYLCYFPQCGWTIHDLWDGIDIHMDGAQFLDQVLHFITYENVNHMRAFALDWSTKNRDRLDIIGGDLTGLYDPHNHLAFVDAVFVNGELDVYPRVFLWHVVHFMRTSMLNTALKQQAAAAAAAAEINTQGVANLEDDNNSGQATLDTEPVIEAKVEEQQPSPKTTPGSASRKNNRKTTRQSRKQEVTVLPELVPPALDLSPPVAINAVSVPFAQPPSAILPARSLPFARTQPHPTASPSQLPGYIRGGPASMQSPYMNPSSLQIPRTRSVRQGSGLYNQSAPHQRGWAENYPMQQMPGYQSRQSSGPVLAGQSPQYHVPVPMGQHMMNAMNPMVPYPQGPTMISPPMAPGQMFYGPMRNPMNGYMNGHMMHPSMVQPQLFPFGVPSMEFSQQNCPPGLSVPRGMTTGNMSNHPQYPYNPSLPPPEQRTNMSRRGVQTNKVLELFNPYGADNPGFASLPARPGGRKAGRNSFSNNNTGRDRKTSIDTLAQSSQGIDRPEQNVQYGGDRHTDAPYRRTSSNNNSFNEVDMTVSGDKERGCGQDWMGPGNDYVDFLWVCNLPRNPDPTIGELKKMFEACVKVPVAMVRIQLDKCNMPIAYVHFKSASDTRKALSLPNLCLRGEPILVRVPKHFYMIQDPSRSQSRNYYSDVSRVGQTAIPASLPARPVVGPTEQLSRGAKPVRYSPQDARSGPVRGTSCLRAPEISSESGSLQAQQSETQHNSPAKTSNERTLGPQDPLSTLLPIKKNETEQKTPTVVERMTVKSEPQSDKQKAATIGTSTDPVAVKAKHDESVVSSDAKIGTNHDRSTVEALRKPNKKVSSKIKGNAKASHPQSTTSAAVLESPFKSPPPSIPSEPMQPTQQEPSPAHYTQKQSVLENFIEEQQPQEQQLQEQQLQEQQLQEAIQVSPVPAVPSPPADTVQDATLHEKISDQTEVTGVEISARDQPSETASDTRPEAVSDDEERHDVSYHSAQETQSDPCTYEEKNRSSAPSDSQAEEAVSHTTIAIEADGLPAANVEKIEISATKEMVPQPEISEEVSDMSTNASVSTAEVEKKQGAKQTESLSVFAKSKAQKKKVKEAKKKQKKKAKSDKGQPSSSSTPSVSTNTECEITSSGDIRPSRPTSITDLGTLTCREASGSVETDRKTEKKGVDSNRGLPAQAAKDVDVKGNEQTVDGGKLPAPPTKAPTFTSETQIPKVHNDISAQVRNQSLELHLTASSRELGSSAETTSTITGIPDAAPALEEPQVYMNQEKSHLTAVPVLDPLHRKASASSKESTFKASSSNFRTHGHSPQALERQRRHQDILSRHLRDENLSRIAKQVQGASNTVEGWIVEALLKGSKLVSSEEETEKLQDTASIASSVTIRGPMSPSPTAAEFDTPLQTPTSLESQPVVSKKKNKKNKKKAAVATKETGLSERIASQKHVTDHRPFANQFRMIDSVKDEEQEERTGSTYYDDHPPHPLKSDEEVEASRRKISGMTLLESLTDYQKHKVIASHRVQAHLPDEPQTLKPVEPLYREEIDTIINGPKKPLGQRLLQETVRKIPKAGTIPFFEPEEDQGL